MNRLLITLLGIVCVTAGNVMLQTADHNAFTEIFKDYAKQSEFGGKLFAELASKIKKGATLQDLNDHVEELRQHLAADEEEDEKYFLNQQQQLEARLQGIVDEVEELQGYVTASASRLEVLNQQQQIIENLFANDQTAYQKRLGDQNSILEIIDALIERVHELQNQGHSLIQKDDLLEEIKQLGRGKHVEVLAQITAHLDQEQVDKILNLFTQLRDAVLSSLEADEAKEQENIRLYNKLTGEITSSLSETNRQHEELEGHLYEKQLQLNQEKEGVKDVGEKLQDRNDQRDFLLTRVEEAQKLLSDNLDRIARWSVE